MDYIRTAYTVPLRMWQDDSATVQVRWFRALPGARVFTGPNAFASSVWTFDDDEFYRPPVFNPVGETIQAPGPYDVGRNIIPYRGKGYCGPGEAFGVGGDHNTNPGIPTQPDGFARCCLVPKKFNDPFLSPETPLVALGITIFDALYMGALPVPLDDAAPNDNIELPDRAALYLFQTAGDAVITGAEPDDIRQVVWLANPTAFNVTVKHNHVAADPGAAFLLPGEDDMVIGPNEGAMFWNDEMKAGWRFIGLAGGGGGGGGLKTATVGLGERKSVAGPGWLVPWDAALEDTGGFWDPAIPTQLIAREAGHYFVSVTLLTYGDANSFRGLSIEPDLPLQFVGGVTGNSGAFGALVVLNASGIWKADADDRLVFLVDIETVTTPAEVWDTYVAGGTPPQFWNSVAYIVKLDGGGGGGVRSVPGGSNGDVQYNLFGTFGGEPQVTPTQGGTGIDTSAATGRPKVATGAWSLAPIDLSSEVTNNLSVVHLDSGTGADSTTFWRGDGLWRPGGGAPDGPEGAVQWNHSGAFRGTSKLYVDADNSLHLDWDAAITGFGLYLSAAGVPLWQWGTKLQTFAQNLVMRDAFPQLNLGGGVFYLGVSGGISLLQSYGAMQLNPGALGGTGALGFWGASEVARPTITGSRSGNAALASLLTALAAYGLVVDSSSP